MTCSGGCRRFISSDLSFVCDDDGSRGETEEWAKTVSLYSDAARLVKGLSD